MALAVAVRIDFIDETGATSFTKIRVPTGFTVAQYVEFATAFGAFVLPVTTCQITGISLSFDLGLSGLGLKAVALGTADVFRKGFFIFRAAIAGFSKKLGLPTFLETKVPTGTDAIDQGDADVLAFINAMTNGIAVSGPITIQPTDERGNDLTTISVAREIHRRGY